MNVLTQESIRRAGETIQKFLSYYQNPETQQLQEPRVAFTEDIGNSKPLMELIDLMTGDAGVENLELASEVRFPFEKYASFDPSKLVHDFVIKTLFRDKDTLTGAIHSIDGAEEIFDLAAMCSSSESLLIATDKSLVSDALLLLKDKARSIVRKGFMTETEYRIFSQLVDRAISRAREYERSGAQRGVQPAQQTTAIDPTAAIDGSRHVWYMPAGNGVGWRYGARSSNGNVHRATDYDRGSGGSPHVIAPCDLIILEVVEPDPDPNLRYRTTEALLDGGHGWTPYIKAAYAYDQNLIFYFKHVVEKAGRSMRTGLVQTEVNLSSVAHAETGQAQEIGAAGRLGKYWKRVNDGSGSIVRAGTEIGEYTNYGWTIPPSGRTRGVPHLHLELVYRGTRTDPNAFLLTMKSQGNVRYDNLLSQALTDAATAYGQTSHGIGAAAGALVDREPQLPQVTGPMGASTYSIASLTENAVQRVIARASSAAIRTMTNDISAKVEHIAVDILPGTAVYVPLEGENAPVVQSTGGRTVQTTIQLTDVDLLNLAKLVVMFRSDKRDETLLSMLTLARSAYRSGSGRRRLTYLYNYVTTQHLGRILTSMTGASETKNLRLDEPVRIENDILNGIGLQTFLPTNITVENDPDRALAFKVTLQFTYINLGYRSQESLKRPKQGTTAPMLPIAVRVGPEEERSTAANVEGKDALMRFLGATSRVSLRFTMAEFMPIYVMYRLGILYDKIIDLGRDGAVVDLSDVATLLNLGMGQTISEDLISRVRRLQDRYSGEPGYWKAAFPSTGDILKPVMGAISSVSSQARISDRAQGFARATASFLGMQSVEAILNMGYIYKHTTPEARRAEEYKWISFNVPSLVPLMSFEMLRDFIKRHREGTELEWVKEVANGASGFLAISGTRTSNPNSIYETSHRRLTRFGSIIKAKVPGAIAGEYQVKDLEGFDITYYVTGIYNDGVPELNNAMATGIYASYADTKKAFEDTISILRSMSSPARAGADSTNLFLAMTAAGVNLMSLGVIRDMKEMSQPASSSSLDGNPIALGAIEVAALRLNAYPGTQRHVIEAVKAVLTMGHMDTLAGMMVAGETADALSQVERRLQTEYDTVARGASGTEQLALRTILASTQAVVRSLNESITSARAVAVEHNVNTVELLSGMFVDDSYTSGVLRTGYCDALLVSLAAAERIAYGPTGTVVITTNDVRRTIEIPTILTFMQAMHPSIGRAIWERFVFMHAAVLSFIMKIIVPLVIIAVAIVLNIIAATLAGASGGTLTALAGFVTGLTAKLLMFYTAAQEAIDLLLGQSFRLALNIGSRIVLGEWLNGRLKEGTTMEDFAELCFHAGIWSSHILTYSVDAHDDLESSFVDYPVVIVDGKPLPPDFYVYKVGMIAPAYQEMVTSIRDIMEVAEQRYGNVDVNDFGAMLEDLLARMQGVARDMLAQAGGALSSEVHRWVTGAEPFFGQAGSSEATPTIMAFRQRNSADFNRVVSQYAKIANCISKQLFNDDGYKFCNIQVQANGSIINAGAFGAEAAILNVIVNMDNRMVTITPTVTDPVRFNITREITTSDIERSNQLRNYSGLQGTDISPSIVAYVGEQVNEVSRGLSTFSATSLLAIRGSLPDTLSYLSMVRSLVGSSLRAVGQVGLGDMRRQLREISRTQLRKAIQFSSGYIFPTLKLYFIEEDSESFYMFDDLYSYASVVDVSVHMDRTSPIQTCIIRVTNIKGYLNDIVADEMNMEDNFTRGMDENAPLHALLLKAGCKIKLQAGNTPILDETNTVFTGRISSINFGDITTIEAISHGSVLTEEVSPGQVKVFGLEESLDASAISTSLGQARRWLARVAFWTDDYKRPISKVKDIISYVLTSITATSGRLDDFTIAAPVSAEVDSTLKSTSNTIKEFMYYKYFPMRMNQVSRRLGLDIEMSANKQLFENIHLGASTKVDDRWYSWVGMDEGAWISKDETGWDILSEINLLLPNAVLTVRPYNTRGTLVWGDADGYYRYRRSTDLESLGATMCVGKLINMGAVDTSRFLALLAMIKEQVRSGRPEGVNAALTLITLMSYFGRLISSTMSLPLSGGVVNPPTVLNRLEINLGSPETAVPNALRWFCMKPTQTEFTADDISSVIDKYTTELKKIYKSIAEFSDDAEYEKGVGALTIEKISADTLPFYQSNFVYGPTPSNRGPVEGRIQTVRHLLSIDSAASELLQYLTRTCLGNSSAHRPVSDYHMKMSGRDIVRNDIELLEPFNAVRIRYPDKERSAENMAEEAFNAQVDNVGEQTVPVHHTLKPWDWKVYATYFKNVNVFPSARTSVISMATSSILSNLMKETYGGNIVLLGDPSIREHDRVLIWDANRDLFGLVGVRSHTFIFSQQEGCISVIEPDMLTRNEYILSDNMIDMTFWRIHWLMKGIQAFTLGFQALGIAKQLMRGAIIRGSTDGILNRTMRTVRNAGAQARGTALGRLYGRTRDAAGSILRRFGATMSRTIPGTRGFGGRGMMNMENIDLVVKDERMRTAVVEQTMEAMRVLDDAMTQPTLRGKLATELDDVMHAATGGNNAAFASDQSRLTTIIEDAWTQAKNAATAYSGSRPIEPSAIRTRFVENLERQLTDMVRSSNRNATSDSIEQLTRAIRTSVPESVEVNGATIQLSRFFDDLMARNEGTITAMATAAGQQANVAKYMEGVRFIMDSLCFGNWHVGSMIKKFVSYASAFWTVDWAVSSVREISDMWLTNTECQDNVAITPMFFRGEPFVAGLDGVTKNEGQRYGFGDLLAGRLSALGDALSHSVHDPVVRQVYQWLRSKAAMERQQNLTRRATPPR